MSNWHPKPIRPQDPNPLFQKDEGFTVKKSADLSPIQQQRLQDGTQHTRGSQYRVPVGRLPQVGGPTLYLGEVEKSVKDEAPAVNPDDVVKGFLSKGLEIEIEEDDDEEETEKAASPSMGEKLGAAAGKTVQTAGKVAGKVVGTAVGLSQQR